MPHPSVPGWITAYADIAWPVLITGWILSDYFQLTKWLLKKLKERKK